MDFTSYWGYYGTKAHVPQAYSPKCKICYLKTKHDVMWLVTLNHAQTKTSNFSKLEAIFPAESLGDQAFL